MKVVLTGASGFIGTHVARALRDQQIEFVTVGRRATPYSAQHVVCDILSDGDLSRAFADVRASHLIHLAWFAEHGKYWTSDYNLDHTRSTCKLLDQFYRQGGRHALISGTCAEYDWRQGYCVEGLTPELPGTLYGTAKDATRRLSQHIAASHGTTLTWARLFYPYGSNEASTRLIPSLFAAFRAVAPFFPVNRSIYRDLLHASDVASALLACTKSAADGLFNISSGEPLALDTLVRTVASLCQGEQASVPDGQPHRVGEPKLLVGQNEKLKALGWRPSVTLVEGLATYL